MQLHPLARLRTAIRACGWLALASCGAPDSRETAAPRANTIADSLGSALSTWTMRPEGFGPLVAGQRVAELATRVPGTFIVPSGAAPTCAYVVWDSAPPGVHVMVEHDTVVRIDVTEGRAIATAAGARIGDSEARIDSLYGGRIESRPHKYTDGRYLIVPARTDTTRRLVFETDGARVTRYRAGLLPAVEYVEGCG